MPPGQVVTTKFPVLHAGSVPNLSRDTWSLTVHGEVRSPATFTYEQFLQLPKTTLTCDIHCVTSWSKLDTCWEGVKFKDLMAIVQPIARANFGVFECEQGFTTSLPMNDLMDEDVLLAYRYDGRDLELEHGGPVRALVPKKYFYKSAKWVRGIKLVEEDEPGFWEVRGYSNTADPWLNDRYSIDFSDIFNMRRRVLGRRSA